MSDDAPPEPAEEEEDDSEASRRMASLVKRSLAAEPAAAPDDRLLRGVQRKIRQRSRGKFYGDGWSTTNARASYALIALAMLVVVGVAYFALGPVGIAPR